jgi:hypothetical protein
VKGGFFFNFLTTIYAAEFLNWKGFPQAWLATPQIFGLKIEG